MYKRKISNQTLDIAKFGSKLVAAGLGAIWISGIWILSYYYFFEPNLLTNPKIWAKLIIVSILTINGVLIHLYALPSLKSNVGNSVLDGDFTTVTARYLPIVAVSAVSWGFAFILGAFKELNNTVPIETFILLYIGTVASAYVSLIAYSWVNANNNDYISISKI